MREYLVFIHQPNSPMVAKVEVVLAQSRREALKKLRKMGFTKKRF